MIFGEFLAAILIAVLVGVVFYYGFRKTGPWGSFWSFLLLLFLGIWAFSLWTEPVGPMYWGVGWVPLLFVGLLFALILAAATPPYSPTEEPAPHERAQRVPEDEPSAGGVVAIGLFFWLMVLLFVVAILLAFASTAVNT